MTTPSSRAAATSELQASYADRLAADLDRVAEQQQRLNAEIASLQEQLTALQHDHAMLQSMHTALQALTPAAGQGGGARARGGAGGRPSPRRARGGARPAARKAAAPRTGGSARTRPTLVDLIRGYLAAQDEPRSAAEITDALTRANPQRDIKPKVVRTTIEVLVGRGLVQRHKHNRSVTYTARSQAARPGAS